MSSQTPGTDGGPGRGGDIDVLAMGRVGVDLYPQQTGVPLDEVTSFGRYLGGSATNVAVAAARLGRRAAIVTRTGADPFATFVRRALRDLGVDDRYVADVDHLPTPITFCEVFPPDHFPIYFYRYPKAPDMEIRPEELDLDAVRGAGVLWLTVTGLSDEPSRSAHETALQVRARMRHTVLDLDYRAVFWESREAARREIGKALPHVTVAVGNLDECLTAVGERDADAAAQALIDRGVELAVVKQGPRGVLGRTADERAVVASHDVDVVNGLGAGDGFGGALCHGLLSGWPLERTLAYANAAGAIVATRLECSTAMPSAETVDAFLRRATR